MKGYVILGAAAATVAIAACTTAEPQQPAASSQNDKTYVTGSRLPVKSGSGTGGEVQSIEGKQSIDAMTRPSPGSQPAGK